MKYYVLKMIDGIIHYWPERGYGEFENIGIIFREYHLPSLKEVLQSKKFSVYGYGGDSLRLLPHEGDMVGIGSMFDYEDDENYQETFIPRINLIELLDQWLEIRPLRSPKVFIIKEDKKVYLTTKFPTQYGELKKTNVSYKLSKSNDENINLIGGLLEGVINNEKLLQEYRSERQNLNWMVNDLKVMRYGGSKFRVEGKSHYCSLNRIEFLDLIKEWQKLVKQGPEKIYLVLEDGDFRVTDKCNPL